MLMPQSLEPKVPLTFHWFPEDPGRRVEWLEAIRNPSLNMKNVIDAMVCSVHFTLNDFEKAEGSELSSLKPDGVPSINIPSEKKVSMLASMSSHKSDGSPGPSSPVHVLSTPLVGSDPSRPCGKMPSVSEPHQKLVDSQEKRNTVPSTGQTACLYPTKPTITSSAEVTELLVENSLDPDSTVSKVPLFDSSRLQDQSYLVHKKIQTTKAHHPKPQKPLALTPSQPQSRLTAPTIPYIAKLPEAEIACGNKKIIYVGKTLPFVCKTGTKIAPQHSIHDQGSLMTSKKVVIGNVVELERTKQTQTTDPPDVEAMKQRMIELERKAEQLELKLAILALKHSQTTKTMKALKLRLFRSNQRVTKHKETIESLKKIVEGQQVKNKVLQNELEKLMPKPPITRPLKVYMPSDVADSEINLSPKIRTSIQSCVQPITGRRVGAFKSLNEKLLGTTLKRKKSHLGAESSKKPFLPSNSSGSLTVHSNVSENGTTVYYLKPTAKHKPETSGSLEIDTNKYRMIETNDFTFRYAETSQTRTNESLELLEDTKAIEVILSFDGGLVAE